MLRGFNNFQYVAGNVLTTRLTANWGTSITPAQNAYGSYTSILAGGSILYDCYWLTVCINSVAVNVNAKDCLVTIGVDASGGTSYTTLIPDLLAACAAPMITGFTVFGGIWYNFPLFVKAGSQLAAKGSVNNATVGTIRIAIWLSGQPSRPDLINYGTAVEAIGITAASSSGTAITPGTTSEGAWTSLGTSTRRAFFWQFGVGVNDSGMGGGSSHIGYTAELSTGNGTNNLIIIPDTILNMSSGEELEVHPHLGWRDVVSGATIYGRLQCNGTADTGISMAAYGVHA
jgi:hypothetical protein